MLFGIDLDGIVFDFCKGFRGWLDEKLHIHLEQEEITSYYWYESSDKINKAIFDEEFDKFGYAGGYRTLEVLPGALRGLERIMAAGHEIMYITNRPLYAYDSTVEALRDHAMPFRERLWFAKGTKSPIINAFNVGVFIDDSPRTIEEVTANTKARIYCMDYPFNRHLETKGIKNFTRVKGWGDFLDRENLYVDTFQLTT